MSFHDVFSLHISDREKSLYTIFWRLIGGKGEAKKRSSLKEGICEGRGEE